MQSVVSQACHLKLSVWVSDPRAFVFVYVWLNVSVCACVCACVCLHACIMQWSSECVILDCPPWLCAKLSTDQNHRIDAHTRTDASLEGNQSSTHLQTCFDPQATDGHLSSLSPLPHTHTHTYTYTPSMFPLFLSLWICPVSPFFFIPPS